jgi:hypothetical protein
MKSNPWKENFSKAAKYAVYYKPSLSVLLALVLALALCEFGRFVGVLDRRDWPNTIQFTFLGITLIYVLTNSAKIDLLKRFVDRDAHYRDTKTLWLEQASESVSEGKKASDAK